MFMLSNYREPTLSWTSQWQPLQEEYRTVCAALQIKPNAQIVTYLTSLVEKHRKRSAVAAASIAAELDERLPSSPMAAVESDGGVVVDGVRVSTSTSNPSPEVGFYGGIRELDFSTAFLGAKGVLPLLSVVRRCVGLVSLNLSSVGLSDYACTTLCADLAAHPTLRVVNLSGNAISADSSDALKTLAHAWSMREITRSLTEKQRKSDASPGSVMTRTPLSILIDRGVGILESTVAALRAITIDEVAVRKENPPLSTPLFMVSRPAVSLEKKKTASLNAPCPPKYSEMSVFLEVKQMEKRLKMMESLRPMVPNRMVRMSADRWLVLSVFISSTFREFPDEASLIHKIIFPRVNHRLRKFRIHLVPVMLHTANEEFFSHGATREANGPSPLDYTRLPPWRKHKRHFDEDRLGRRHGLMFNEEGAYSSEVRHLLIQGSCDAFVSLQSEMFDPRVHPTDWDAARHGLDHSVPTFVMRRKASGVPAELAHLHDYHASLAERITAESLNLGQRSFGVLTKAEVRAHIEAQAEVWAAFQRQVASETPKELICSYDATYQRVNHDGDVRFAVEETFVSDMMMFLMSMAYTYYDRRAKGQCEPRPTVIDPEDAMKRAAINIPVITKHNWGDPKHLAKKPTFRKDVSRRLVADIRTEQEIVRQRLNLPPVSERLSMIRGSSVGGTTAAALALAAATNADRQTSMPVKSPLGVEADLPLNGKDGAESSGSSSLDTTDMEGSTCRAPNFSDEDDDEEMYALSENREVTETCFSCIQGARGSGKTTQLRSVAAQIAKDPLAVVATHRVIGGRTSLMSVMVGLLQQLNRRYDEGAGSVFQRFNFLKLFQEDSPVEEKEECLVDAFCAALKNAPVLRAELTRICLFIDDDDAITEVANFGGVRKTFAELFLSRPHRIAKLQHEGVKRPGHCVVQVFYTSTLDQTEFVHSDAARTPLTSPFPFRLLANADASENPSEFCGPLVTTGGGGGEAGGGGLHRKRSSSAGVFDDGVPQEIIGVTDGEEGPLSQGFGSRVGTAGHALLRQASSGVGFVNQQDFLANRHAARSAQSVVFAGSTATKARRHRFFGRPLLTVVPVPRFSEFEAADLFYYFAIGSGEYATYATSSLKARVCEAAKLLVLNKAHATRPLYMFLAAREVAYYQESVPIAAIVEAIPGTIDELAITAIKLALPPDLECVFEAIGTAPEPLEGSILRYAMRTHRMFPYFTQKTSEKEWWCTPRSWGRLGLPVMCSVGLLATVNANFIHLFDHNARLPGQGFVVKRWSGVTTNMWRAPWVVAHRTVAEALWKLYDPDRKINTKSKFYENVVATATTGRGNLLTPSGGSTLASLRSVHDEDRIAHTPQGYLRTPASVVLWDRPLKRLALLREGSPHLVRATALLLDPHALFRSPQRLYALLHDKANDDLLLGMLHAYGVLMEEHQISTEGPKARAPTTSPTAAPPSPTHTLQTLKLLRDCAIFFDKHWQTLLRHKLFWFTGLHQMPPTLKGAMAAANRANPNTNLRVGSRYHYADPSEVPSPSVLALTPHSTQECHGLTIRLGSAPLATLSEGGMFGLVGGANVEGEAHDAANAEGKLSTIPPIGKIKSFVLASKYAKRFAVVYESIDAASVQINDITPALCDVAASPLRRIDGTRPAGFGSFTVLVAVTTITARGSPSSAPSSVTTIAAMTATPFTKALSGVEIMEATDGIRIATAAYHEHSIHIFGVTVPTAGTSQSSPKLIPLAEVKVQLQGVRAIVRGLSISPFLSQAAGGSSVVRAEDTPMVAYACKNALKVVEQTSASTKSTPSTHTFTDAHETQIVLTGFSPAGTKIFSIDDRAHVFVWGAPKTPFSGNVLAVTEFPAVPATAFFVDDETIAYVYDKGIRTWNSNTSEIGPLITNPDKSASKTSSKGQPLALNLYGLVYQEFRPAALSERLHNPKSLQGDEFCSPLPAAIAVFDPHDKAIKLFPSTRYQLFLDSTAPDDLAGSSVSTSATSTAASHRQNGAEDAKGQRFCSICSFDEYCVVQPYSSNTDTIGNHGMTQWTWRFGLHHAVAIDTRENMVKVFDLRERRQVPMYFGVAFEKNSVEEREHLMRRLVAIQDRKAARRDRRVKELMEEQGFQDDDDMAELFDQEDVLDILGLDDDEDDDEEEVAKAAAMEVAEVGADGEAVPVSGTDAQALKGSPVFIQLDDIGILCTDDVADVRESGRGTPSTPHPAEGSNFIVVADSRGYVHALTLTDGPLTYPSNPLTTC